MAVFVAVRNRLERGETASGTERCSHEERKRAEERYLNALVEQALERQRQAYLESEWTSPAQGREDIRVAVLREHRSRLRAILAAACRGSRRVGESLGDRSGGGSARQASGGPGSATRSVAASAELGSPRAAQTGQARTGRPARERGASRPPADAERRSTPASAPPNAVGELRQGDASRDTRQERRRKRIEKKAHGTRVEVASPVSPPGSPSPDTKKGPTSADKTKKRGRGDGGWQL